MRSPDRCTIAIWRRSRSNSLTPRRTDSIGAEVISGLSRFLPNIREIAEETKRRAWQQHGMLVVDVDKVPTSWDVCETLNHLGEKLYGRQKGSIEQ